MSRLEALTSATAVGASRELLADLEERHQQVGEMVRTMAHSPAVLGGYLQLSRAMKRAKLDRRISERISIAVQVHQGCELCLDSHITAARTLGVTETEIELARRGTSADPAVAAMVNYGLRLYTEPVTITDQVVSALRGHGFRDREIADVAGIVALNVITGAFNLAAGVGAAASG